MYIYREIPINSVVHEQVGPSRGIPNFRRPISGSSEIRAIAVWPESSPPHTIQAQFHPFGQSGWTKLGFLSLFKPYITSIGKLATELHIIPFRAGLALEFFFFFFIKIQILSRPTFEIYKSRPRVSTQAQRPEPNGFCYCKLLNPPLIGFRFINYIFILIFIIFRPFMYFNHVTTDINLMVNAIGIKNDFLYGCYTNVLLILKL